MNVMAICKHLCSGWPIIAFVVPKERENIADDSIVNIKDLKSKIILYFLALALGCYIRGMGLLIAKWQ